MKFNYFKILEDKYKTRLSVKSPIIIRLDGKNICKNKEINMLDEDSYGFAFALKKAGTFFSRKFNCIALASSDELNLIILEPGQIKRTYGNLECQKVSSFIAQEVAFVFNSNFSGERIMFDARTFNIPSHKVSSYILYRTQSAKNVYTVYYAKKLLSSFERKGKKMYEIDEILCSISDEFKNRSMHNTIGTAYVNGAATSIDTLLDYQIYQKNFSQILNNAPTVSIIDDYLDNSDDDLFA